MFDIEYKGANSVVISTKKVSLITDPKSAGINSAKDQIELATEERFLTNDQDAILSVSYPGSYEVSDFSINGFAEKRHIDHDDSKRSVVYSIEVGGARIGLIGNIAPDISDEQLENLGVLDMLILPVGGNGYTLDATSAANIARRSDAKVIIPVHYNDGTDYEVSQDDIELFVKEMGLEVEKTTKYKFKSVGTLPEKSVIVQIEKSK